jgi:hypothetical protein
MKIMNKYLLYISDLKLNSDIVGFAEFVESNSVNIFYFIKIQRFVQAHLTGSLPHEYQYYDVYINKEKIGEVFISTCNRYRTNFLSNNYLEVTLNIFNAYQKLGYGKIVLKSILKVHPNCIAMVRFDNIPSNSIFKKIFGEPVAVISRESGILGARYIT